MTTGGLSVKNVRKNSKLQHFSRLINIKGIGHT